MLRNFFKTALRNIIKYRAYSLINFVGLTSGLALSLLIITYVRSELSYDRFHTKADRIYRLRYTAPNGMELATTPPPIAPRLKEFFPEVEDAGRMYGRNVSISRPDDSEVFEETDVFFADPAIMNILSFEFVKGTPEGALNDEFTVLITEEMATKYFGERNPVGQTLRFSNAHAFTVTGVVKNFPINSHIRFNMLVPYENMYDLETDQAATAMRHNFEINYVISHSYTYVMLKPGADPASVNSKMGDFIKKYAQPSLQVGQVFALMPLVDIHLNSTLLAEPSPTNSMSNLIIFAGIGMLTLLIASINYINLSTAQSLTRIKEIGIRKIMGSMRYQLISQFLAESFLFCLIALLLSFAIFHSLLPMLNEVTGKNLQFNEVVDSFLMFSSLILLVIITLLAGGYPAYFVTRFNSVHALKGDRLPLGGSQFMRKVLVVFQLTIACMLLTGSLIIMKQIDFLDNRPLGFKKDQVITVPLFSQNVNGIFRQDDSTYRNRLQSFRNMIEAQSGVRKTTLSSTPPGLGAMFRGTVPEGFTE
ncbi:MAG: ABC transporter permease [Chryseosolibacter sp.]